MNFYKFFKNAMDRDIFPLKYPIGNYILNLGSGNKELIIPEGAEIINFDYPDWDADFGRIPFTSWSFDVIYAFHFLEHCKYPIKILQECQRVLKKDGLMYICVPYYSSALQAQDLDHKHSFTEETWKTLFKNKYYNKNKFEWEFKIGFNLICGIVERNLCLLTQLIKE